MTKSEYERTRKAILSELNRITETADKENRARLSVVEDKRSKELFQELEELDTEWQGRGHAIVGQQDEVLDNGGYGGPGDRPGGEHLFVRTASGREIRVVEPSESIRVAMPNLEDPGGLSIGRFVRAAVSGDWQHAKRESEAVRTMSGASDLLGGFLLPDPLSAQVVDAARAEARVIQAGARTIPMTEGTMKIATVAGDPSTYWRFEGVDVTESDATFAQTVLTARTVAALVRTSVELIEDASNLDQLLTSMLGKAVALEIDRCALRGSGAAGEPRGILNTVGINTVAAGGNITYADFSTAVQNIAEANGEARAAIYAPRTAGEMDRFQDTTNQPMQPPESFKALRKFTTTQVPITLGGGTDTEAYVGDFKNLWIGVRTSARVEASRVADDAFKKLQVLIRIYARADVAVIRPAFFTAITGITAV